MRDLNKLHRGNVEKNQVVYLTTFPPRKCGIATFTYDLTQAMDSLFEPAIKSNIVAMNASEVSSYRYSGKVIFQINQENAREYITVAEKLNRINTIKAVSIQHEFGIFGGEWGLYLIPFLETLCKPKVITFHSVLTDPSKSIQGAVRLLADSCNAIVVMAQLSRTILIKDYGISAEKIRIIPHGVHDKPYVLSGSVKREKEVRNKTILTTFGMLNRNKGLEYVIEGLPRVLEKHQDFVYIIVGVTHPNILKTEGETYRNALIKRVNELGVSNHVRFYNQYFSISELLNFLSMTDIYISTSIDPGQAVSGTLAYAMGMGRPIISTAFAHAKEIVTDDVGILVDFRNSHDFSDAIIRLLEDEGLRMSLGRNAYFKTRSWTWPNVAIRYANLFSEFATDVAETIQQKALPPIKLTHLMRLTDDFGIIQFAKLSQPDLSSGYTLDDNARALMTVVLYTERLRTEKQSRFTFGKRGLLKRIETYLNFVKLSAGYNMYFQNYFNADKTMNEKRNQRVNLEETNGRALYALALTSSIRSIPKRITDKALTTMQEKVQQNISFQSPRAIAWYVKAICVLMNKNIVVPGINLEDILRQQCNILLSIYQDTRSPGWEWFERYLTYSNGLLSEALLQGYLVTGEDRYRRIGKATLEFLIERSFNKDIFSPIGQDGWSHRDGEHNHFDQQPEEVMSMVYALKACYAVTGEEYYKILMRRVFNWFLGDNSLEQIVYDRTTGGCYDGVGRENVNLNQGAESTLSYLLARLAL